MYSELGEILEEDPPLSTLMERIVKRPTRADDPGVVRAFATALLYYKRSFVRCASIMSKQKEVVITTHIVDDEGGRGGGDKVDRRGDETPIDHIEHIKQQSITSPVKSKTRTLARRMR